MVARLDYKCRGCGKIYDKQLSVGEGKLLFIVAIDVLQDPSRVIEIHECAFDGDLGIADLIRIRRDHNGR